MPSRKRRARSKSAKSRRTRSRARVRAKSRRTYKSRTKSRRRQLRGGARSKRKVSKTCKPKKSPSSYAMKKCLATPGWTWVPGNGCMKVKSACGPCVAVAPCPPATLTPTTSANTTPAPAKVPTGPTAAPLAASTPGIRSALKGAPNQAGPVQPAPVAASAPLFPAAPEPPPPAPPQFQVGVPAKVVSPATAAAAAAQAAFPEQQNEAFTAAFGNQLGV